MARDRERGDSISPSTGQSKRPSNAHDSDSLDSDQTQHAQHAHQLPQPHQQQHQQQRKSHQKHHVGAGAPRLHARTTSSKALYKHNATTSSTKLTRRLTSPSPDRSTASAAASLAPSNHRRNQSSEVKLSRDPSSTNLKKNTSQTSLKRNRSHVDVGKRSKSSAQLKRSASEKAVHKLKPTKSAVHFDIGFAGPQDDEDNEWVDASSSASPYLSRRGSANNSGQSSAQPLASPRRDPLAGSNGNSGADTEDDGDGNEEPTPLADPNRLLFDDATQHSRSLTSRLLQRTPSHSATTSMSNMTAMAKAASPDSRHSASTLSVTPALTEPQGMVGSNGTQQVTSRFITSQNSGGSYSTPDGRTEERPQSRGGLSGPTDTGLSTATTVMRDDDEDEDEEELTDEEDTGITSAIATTARSRTEVGVPAAAPPEKSRTQQKINLQRASSSMEPVRHRHSGIGGFAAEVAEVAGPLLGGAGYESQDPRVNKLLERTGVEYNIVRRYQNPVARSLVRLAQLPGNDQARRIPRGNAAAATLSSRHSVHGFPGLSQSFRENGGGSRSRPATPKRAYSSVRHNGAGSSLDTDDGGAVGRMHEAHGQGQRLSGASLVNDGEDEGIQAILRSMWDKNLVDLAASSD